MLSVISSLLIFIYVCYFSFSLFSHPLLQGGSRPVAPSAIAAAGGNFRQITKDTPWIDHEANAITKNG